MSIATLLFPLLCLELSRSRAESPLNQILFPRRLLLLLSRIIQLPHDSVPHKNKNKGADEAKKDAELSAGVTCHVGFARVPAARIVALRWVGPVRDSRIGLDAATVSGGLLFPESLLGKTVVRLC